MDGEYRTLLALDTARYRVEPDFLIAQCVEHKEGYRVAEILKGISTIQQVREEQLRAFLFPPIGFIIRRQGAEALNGVKIVGQSNEGVLLEGHITLNPPKVFHFMDFSPNGVYRFNTESSEDTLTTGGCLRINALFEQHGWPIQFTDEFIVRNKSSLQPDGTIQGCR